MEVSTAQVAKFYGVSAMALTKWRRAGADVAYLDRNRWNLKLLNDWWIRNIYQGPINSVPEDDSPVGHKDEYWKWKTEAEKAKVQQMKGKLISFADVKEQWTSRVSLVTSALNAFANRLPAILVGKSRNEMADILKAEIKNLRRSFVKRGKYTPK